MGYKLQSYLNSQQVLDHVTHIGNQLTTALKVVESRDSIISDN